MGSPIAIWSLRYPKSDRSEEFGKPISSWNPASHAGYWTDREVLDTIAASLVRTWKVVNTVNNR